jgi:hypothetical protein
LREGVMAIFASKPIWASLFLSAGFSSKSSERIPAT